MATKIAILGAGFAGLATAYALLQQSQAFINLDIYDPLPLGKNASGLSSGLLHPYSGKQAKLAWEAEESLRAAHDLISASTEALNQSVVVAKGIFRPAITEEQCQNFKRCAELHPDVSWWSADQAMERISGLLLPPQGGGIFLTEGLTLNTPAYLEGLWQACAKLGAQLIPHAITMPQQLSNYDHTILALGSISPLFMPELNLQVIKGQLLELTWPENLTPLSYSLVGAGYVVPKPALKRCVIGATYERDFKESLPDLERAKREILPKVLPFFPSLEESEIVGCYAGVRVTTGGLRLPMVGKVHEKLWTITALGSKGLLYHAWLGKLLASALLNNDLSLLPASCALRTK